ncbi:O-antigen ligase [Legionella sp. km772]|uniref:O-antigen ligase family protein n=1 Tax=Legionella sp. km772 TaxID=2498111 RepID=UPI000F8D8D7D|nr:O-antigen ligase family protein [Legionella sp. km772]RUR12085.1 O-antigen ligase family protein [Legionella sp. km772]
MNFQVLQEKGVYLTPILFTLFIFVTPLSPSLRSVFLILALLSVLINPAYNQYLSYTFNTYWGRSALFLVGFVALACLWSPAPLAMQISTVGKYSKILYLPILAVGFINPKTRLWCINAYLGAMLFTCLISLLKAKGVVFIHSNDDVNKLFYNHIVTGFMMALACYIAALQAIKYKGRLKVLYLFIVASTSFQILFLNTGRTGYAIYLVVMAILCLQKLPFKKALFGLFFLSALMIGAYFLSPTMQTGIHNLANDVHSLNADNANSSLGFRFQFHDYARRLFMTQPLIGIGTGAFPYSYSLNPILTWGKWLNEPHSQYWLTLSEQGIIGFSFLLLFLGSLLFACFNLSDKSMLFGIITAVCIGAFFDSILSYSPIGYLLLIFSALNFGEFIEKYADNKKTQQNRVEDKDEIHLSMENSS